MAFIKCPECGKVASAKDRTIIMCVFGGFAIAITLFVLFLKWNNDAFVGTVWDEVIPSVALVFSVAFIILIILSNILKFNSKKR